MAQGTYAFPTIEFDVAVGVTNTTPMGAYRGAGRPEATAMLERLVDQAALELGIDPIEIRRRNFLGDDVFPFRTLTGNTYDSGRYNFPLDRARRRPATTTCEPSRPAGARRATRRCSASASPPTWRSPPAGAGRVRRRRGPRRRHRHDLRRHPVARPGPPDRLRDVGRRPDRHPDRDITLVDGDTDRVRTGGGTGGSRSLQLGGSAVRGATESHGRPRPSSWPPGCWRPTRPTSSSTPRAGTIGVAGVPAQALTWGELAAKATEDGEQLDGEFDFHQEGATFPFGAHIAVVEVDTGTGKVRLRPTRRRRRLRHRARPLLVEGQQHGGIAAGVGQALFEEVRFDDDGNPITSNLADYAILGAPSCRRSRSLDRDADAAQPARGEGHRRGGHDRRHARPSRTR